MLEYGCASSLSPSATEQKSALGLLYKHTKIPEWQKYETEMSHCCYQQCTAALKLSVFTGEKIKPPQILNANRNFTFCLLKGQNKLALLKTKFMLSTGLCSHYKNLAIVKGNSY